MPKSCLKLPSPQDIVAEIEKRAKKIGFNIGAVLAFAEVPRQTVRNWQDGITDPSFRIIEKIQSALETLEKAHR